MSNEFDTITLSSTAYLTEAEMDSEMRNDRHQGDIYSATHSGSPAVAQHNALQFEILNKKLDKLTDLFIRQQQPAIGAEIPHEDVPAVSVFRLRVEAVLDRYLIPDLAAEFVAVFLVICTAILSGIIYPDSAGIRDSMLVIVVGLMLQFSIPISLGHINPAYTVVFWITKGFPFGKVPWYILAQLLAGFWAAMFIVMMRWEAFEARRDFTLARGLDICSVTGPVSMLVAVPNPATPVWKLIAHEAFSMSIQSFGIWFSGEKIRKNVPSFFGGWTVALGVGLAVFVGEGLPIALNPARDLGPRIVAAMFFGTCAMKQPYALIPFFISTITAVLNFIILEYVFANSKKRIEMGHARRVEEDPAMVRMFKDMGDRVFHHRHPPFASGVQVMGDPERAVRTRRPWDLLRGMIRRNRVPDIEMGAAPEMNPRQINGHIT